LSAGSPVLQVRRLNEQELDELHGTHAAGFSFNEQARDFVVALVDGQIVAPRHEEVYFRCGWLRVSDWSEYRARIADTGCLFSRLKEVSAEEFLHNEVGLDTDFSVLHPRPDRSNVWVVLRFVEPADTQVSIDFIDCNWEAVFFEDTEPCDEKPRH